MELGLFDSYKRSKLLKKLKNDLADKDAEILKIIEEDRNALNYGYIKIKFDEYNNIQQEIKKIDPDFEVKPHKNDTRKQKPNENNETADKNKPSNITCTATSE